MCSQVSSKITDATGKTISATDYGGTLTYTYFSHGKVKDVINGTTTLTSNAYDTYARQTSLTDINAGITQYVTDALGQMTLMITATNQTNSYTFDIIGRQISIVRPEGSTTYTYYPSGSGGKTNMLNIITNYGSITEEYLYDLYGRPTTKNETIDGILHQSLFAYNIYNDMISQTYPSEYQVNYNYDVNGFINTIKNGNNTITLYTNNGMNGLGQNTSYTLGNGKTSNTTYYFGTPTNYTASGVQNLSLTWGFQSGNLTSRYDAIKAKTETFTYDNLNRLLSATVTGLAAINSAYSNNGNISSKTDAGTYLYNNSKINAVTNVSNSQNKISFYQPLTITEGISLLTYTSRYIISNI